jgi:hypothetical protein
MAEVERLNLRECVNFVSLADLTMHPVLLDFRGKGDELRCFTTVVMVLKSVLRDAIKLRSRPLCHSVYV